MVEEGCQIVESESAVCKAGQHRACLGAADRDFYRDFHDPDDKTPTAWVCGCLCHPRLEE